jgi:hypothetical protein
VLYLWIPHQIGDDKYNIFFKKSANKIKKREEKNRISYKIIVTQKINKIIM